MKNPSFIWIFKNCFPPVVGFVAVIFFFLIISCPWKQNIQNQFRREVMT